MIRRLRAIASKLFRGDRVGERREMEELLLLQLRDVLDEFHVLQQRFMRNLGYTDEQIARAPCLPLALLDRRELLALADAFAPDGDSLTAIVRKYLPEGTIYEAERIRRDLERAFQEFGAIWLYDVMEPLLVQVGPPRI